MKKLLLFASMMAIPLLSYGQTLLSEDFQTGSLPATWSVVSTNNAFTWHVEDPLLGTDYKATVNYDPAPAAQNEMLVSPSLNLLAGTSYTLKAQIGLSYYWAVTPENTYDAFVKVSTDNGVTWTQLWSELDLGVFENWVMNPVSIDLTPYAGNANVKIAFQYIGNDGAALYVDNVSVIVPPSTPPNCATQVAPANAATGVNYTAPVALSWTAPTGGSAVDSYDVFLGTTANPTTLLGNTAGLTINATGLLGSTTYYWKVIAKNGSGAATSCSEFSFTTSANPFAPYCGPLIYSSGVEPITSVDFGGMVNTSPAATGGTAHELFLSKIANVRQEGTFPIKLQGNTDGGFTTKFIVFIDWNQDGDFLDAGETYFDTVATTIQVVGSTGTDGKEAIGDIVVPADALLGNTRMRIKKNFSGTTFYPNPCFSGGTLAAGTNSGFGQAEDYTVNVGAKLGVSSVNKSQMSVYPNPMKEVLNINSDGKKVTQVSFYSMEGKLVKTVNEDMKNINVNNLPKGVYIVKVKSSDAEQTFKVIKE